MSLLQALADIAVLQTAVSGLQSSVSSLQSSVSSLQSSVASHTSNIASLQSSVSTNASNISSLQTQVAFSASVINTLTDSNNAQQTELDEMSTYLDKCKECGKNGNLHPLYQCSNCGWKKMRNCVKVCRVCNFRNFPQNSGDPLLKECDTCHIDYPIADYNGSSNRCKYCDLVFSTYRNAQKYYLDF